MKLNPDCVKCYWLEPSKEQQCGHPSGPGYYTAGPGLHCSRFKEKAKA